MTFLDCLEVGSDVLGAVSGVVMYVPTHRQLEARRVVNSDLEVDLSPSAPAPVDQQEAAKIQQMLRRADAYASSYNPKDHQLMVWGLRLFILAFALKLVYHALAKVLG